ncbi:MAG: ABC transporter permease [Proteobacteria bacterium]|nr:ABC transporter permease [Pseudomonadota bacterium]
MVKNFIIFFDFIGRLWRSRYMLRTMAARDLKAMYVGSVFGLLWAVLNPLFLVAIYGIVFGVFMKSTPGAVYKTDSFFLFLLCGLVPWQFFTQALTTSSGVLVANSNLVKKAVGFPSEILPIVVVISNIISHLISVALLLIILIIFNHSLPITTPYIFIYLFFAAIFCIGCGWVLSSLNVFSKDVNQILGIAIMGLFFLTPVLYSSDIVPPGALFIMKLNPIYHLVEGYRFALLAGRFLPLPDFIYLAVTSFGMFGLGGVLFRKMKPWFAEVM